MVGGGLMQLAYYGMQDIFKSNNVDEYGKYNKKKIFVILLMNLKKTK